MPTSEAPTTAFVWVWLPDAPDPVVAGRVDRDERGYVFTYGNSYLARSDSISLYLPELPLRPGGILPDAGLDIAGCLLDGGPDSWGQRVILARRLGRLTRDSDTGGLDHLAYFLESASDRIGALDFQRSSKDYVPRGHDRTAALEELMGAADLLETGAVLPPALADALVHGTSIGGARPKALISDGGTGKIAKFSSTTDTSPVVKGEGVAMNLAARIGLDVAGTEVVEVGGRAVLLVDRFDRTPARRRRMMVSLLTMQGLQPMTGRYATYHRFADDIRARFTTPRATLHELFGRIVFNIAIGNTDDHARNHAAFWDGSMLELTPAYDLCPQPRSGDETAQALAIGRGGEREARFTTCVDAAAVYQLTRAEAQAIVDRQVSIIETEWDDAADEARLTAADRAQLWRRQILNQSVFSG